MNGTDGRHGRRFSPFDAELPHGNGFGGTVAYGAFCLLVLVLLLSAAA